MIKVTSTYESARKDCWLPPGIQSKIDHHTQWIDRFLSVLPENTKLVLETARFDIARVKDPDVHGEMYQKGSMYDMENIKAYVFSRDNYVCKACHAKGGSVRKDGTTVKLVRHHIDFRSKGATDNPDSSVTVCDACHTAANHAPGGILYQWMKEGKRIKRGYRDMTLMNIVRRRLFHAYPDASFTYGNITSADRKKLCLKKTHANDAVAVAAGDGEKIKDVPYTQYYKQVRKKKRSLHEATPRKGHKTKNTTAKRNSKNTPFIVVSEKGIQRKISLYDEVHYQGVSCWVTGFSGTGSVYLKDAYGNYVTTSGKYKQVGTSEAVPVRHNNNWISYVS